MKTLLATLLLAAVLPLSAQVPQIINYQGKIAVGSTPFTGTGQFRFALVNGDASTSYWSNDGSSTAGSQPTAAVSLPVVNGLYIVPLGDATLTNMTAIPNAVFANADVRVRVWFNDGSTGSQLLSPDQRITSVGYAMVAGGVTDAAITTAKVADGAITTAKLAPAARPKHDRQMASFSSEVSTSSIGWTDIPSMALTTKQLDETGTYLIQFRASVHGQNGGITEFILNVNGSLQGASQIVQSCTGNGVFEDITITFRVTGLSSGVVIKPQYRAANLSTISVRNSQLTIDGVPSSQVVP